MIKLNDQFSMNWDGFQWHLLEFKMSKKSEGRSKTPKTTYHTSISKVLGVIFERIVGDADGNLENLQAKIKEAKRMVDDFGIDLTAPEAVINPPVLNSSAFNTEGHY